MRARSGLPTRIRTRKLTGNICWAALLEQEDGPQSNRCWQKLGVPVTRLSADLERAAGAAGQSPGARVSGDTFFGGIRSSGPAWDCGGKAQAGKNSRTNMSARSTCCWGV